MVDARRCIALLACGAALGSAGEPMQAVKQAAAAQKQPLLDTLKELTAIESGSRDLEGLDRIANLIAARFKALGGEVELVPAADITRLEDTPAQIGKAVKATFRGKGTKKILLIAHMDTVYLKGMGAQRPFRIDGDHAHGLAIADDKQGIALILHTLQVLKDVGYDGYGTITVSVNPDEEISTPGHRALITRLASESDATMSFEGGGCTVDNVSLATAGIAAVVLRVKGKASHAGSAPEKGVNALVELSHQIVQMKDFSDPASGVRMNWTISKAGTNRTVIPAEAEATADVRVKNISDYDGIEKRVRAAAKKQLVPDAQVEIVFDRRRPPLAAPPASIAFARHAQAVYGELGAKLVVNTVSGGGGTDAAFAGLKATGPVVEGFGLRGCGSHSNNAEYVLVSSIEPRLYLTARMIMDFSQGKVPAR